MPTFCHKAMVSFSNILLLLFYLSHSCLCCCSVQSHVRLFTSPWSAASQTSLSFTISWRLLKLMSIESMIPCIHLVLCNPFSSCLQYFPASESFLMNQLFSSGGQNWSFSFSISPSNEYSGLISFRIYWFDLVVQGTLKSLLQHHSSTPHQFFGIMVQLS